MLNIFKQLARHWKVCLAVALLLVVQAQCDLSLPGYTSRIVDVGITQGGVESPAPEVVRAETLNALLKLMDADTAACPRISPPTMLMVEPICEGMRVPASLMR